MPLTNELIQLWNHAIYSVQGQQSVEQAIIKNSSFKANLIIAIGKAASSMCVGALKHQPTCPAIVITKNNHFDDGLIQYKQVIYYESAHPIPNQRSIMAGNQVIKAIKKLSSQTQLLLLVSGGASSLVEKLADGTTLEQLQHMTQRMIASGASIKEINRHRQSFSLIKNAQLLQHFKGKKIMVYAISDVEGDDINIIGSGIGSCKKNSLICQYKIIASNAMARKQIAIIAKQKGYIIINNEETLYQDVFLLADIIAKKLIKEASTYSHQKRLFIWGGEPTIQLPDNPGIGGRNQSLALAIAIKIKYQNNITILVAGTDGTDGVSQAAGGIVNGNTVKHIVKAQCALNQANAEPYLQQQQALFITGPTHTNVMDLVIAIIN